MKEKEEEPKVTKKPINRPATAASGKPNQKSPVQGSTASKDKCKPSEKNSGSSVEKKVVGKKYDGNSRGQKADRKSFGSRRTGYDNDDSAAPGVASEREPVAGAAGDTSKVLQL